VHPLGVRVWSQSIDAIVALLDVRVGETRVQGVAMVPAAPVYAVGAATKWAQDRIGPAAWIVLAAFVVGGIYLYRRQPQERRRTIRTVAGEIGNFLMEEATNAMNEVQQAQDQLSGCVVPAPPERTVPAAVFRLLAMAEDSMSAHEIYEALDDTVRPAVQPLRTWLHRNKTTVFQEVRRGSFLLGNRYRLTQPVPAL
jgi:hypothetical protein